MEVQLSQSHGVVEDALRKGRKLVVTKPQRLQLSGRPPFDFGAGIVCLLRDDLTNSLQ